MIYFTADTHFFHANIIKLCGRPFSDIEEMNQQLMDNWNACITDRDEIYILGDFIFKNRDGEAEYLVKQLNGKKYLIKGNHDKFFENKNFNKNNFEWIKDYHVLKYKKINFVLFHYPIFEWEGYFGNAIHLYGHVHNSGNNKERHDRFKLLGERAVNVGVDVNNYKPVSIDEIIQTVQQYIPRQETTDNTNKHGDLIF